MAKYKAGQLITIEHKVYRVKKGNVCCIDCAFYREDCNKTFPNCASKIGMGCLQEIKPKNR